MYAAAGGASIANRRKQKRLQLNKQTPVNVIPPRPKGVPPGSRHYQQHYQHHQHQHQHQHQHHHQYQYHHHHHHHPTKLAATRPHQVASAPQVSRTQQQQQAPTSTSSSSGAFHHHHHRHHKSQQVVPVSPIQFPISPPPLSLESSASATTTYPAANKSSNFPFPPPSILDLRVSPPTSELQCGGQGPGGKAAWQGCNRPSPLPLSPTSPGCRGDGYKTKQCEAHRRWMKRNRIRDASYCYGSSGEDDEEDDSSNAIHQRGEVSAAVNTVLYVGLGTTALGLVISFVGTGEKGFLSPQLRLVGPSLLCAGLLCCLFRVLLCLCLCRCGQCRWRFCHVASHKKEKARKADARPGPGLGPGPGPGSGPGLGTLPTASLLPPTQQQRQQERPVAPTSRSVSPATKGHELLLSPAQLPE